MNCAAQVSPTTHPALGTPLWKALAEKVYSPEGPNFKYLPAMQFFCRQASLYSALTFHMTIMSAPFCFAVLQVKMQTYRNKTGHMYNAMVRHIRFFASWTFLRWPYHLIHRDHNFLLLLYFCAELIIYVYINCVQIKFISYI